jgi:hypothetical protein
MKIFFKYFKIQFFIYNLFVKYVLTSLFLNKFRMNSEFEVGVPKLRELMKCRNNDAPEKLNKEFSGAEGLALKLRTNIQTGLVSNETDIANRRRFYGKNEIPPRPPKSIFELAFEAIQDPTLLMLMICAAISIGLSFYHPPAEASEEVFICFL